MGQLKKLYLAQFFEMTQCLDLILNDLSPTEKIASIMVARLARIFLSNKGPVEICLPIETMAKKKDWKSRVSNVGSLVYRYGFKPEKV